MPEHLKELQDVLKQVQEEPRRRRVLDWLRLVGMVSRLGIVIGLLILTGVAGSVIWPHAGRIGGMLQRRPAPPAAMASAPVVAAAPTSQARTAEREKAPVRAKTNQAGGPVSPPSGAPNQPTSGSDGSPNEPPPLHKIGEIFAVGPWEYCVNEATWRKSLKAGDKTIWPGPGAEFLELRLTVCNMGEETAILPPPRLIGPDGTPIDATRKVGPDASVGSEPLSPDRHYKRHVVFEAPRGRPYKVLLRDGWLSHQQADVEVER